MAWTNEKIHTLQRLWSEGYSHGAIATAMQISKNAVVGKANRLNLPKRKSTIFAYIGEFKAANHPKAATIPAPQPTSPSRVTTSVPKPAATPKVHPTPKPQRAPVAAEPRIINPKPPQRITQRECCWPMGEPKTPEFRYCGSVALAGKPYCADHSEIAYVKLRDRRDNVA